MNDYIALIIRTTAIFIFLLLLTRLLGKRQMSQLTFLNYIVGITIGNVAASIIIESEHTLYKFVGLFWWVILAGIIGFISLKWPNFKVLVDGQPTIIIKNGTLVKKALKACRLNMDDVSMMLRERSIFSVQDVDYAILEANGRLSIMKKSEKLEVTKENMNIKVYPSKYLPSEIIVDGTIMKKNLAEYNLNEIWLKEQLKKQNIKSEKEVFFAQLQEDGCLYIEKNKNEK
ncbi:DUF421 domain-containing protein [Anaerosacchariphilus polymeriproducens]|uniref:DUF421 domain-containing protein n=1 Tax=Anaerosacchariphilus polymeriproducens TaxID=1812858 RepID=A0A371AQV8_9FIRM|nr:DUF421 domain-containing protein [Anaerosacchariphilus polymeriproducens]RDU21958.1 DUF421 domain-containing protein [Anaerosacchariphilus polymeriproducens]